MNLQDRINDGLEGKYSGLNNGFNRLNEVVFGVQRRCYTLLGGNSGTFKTTLCDYIVLNAIEDAINKNIKLTVFYYSFEIDKITKQCNWLSQIINRKYSIVIDPETIKGLGTKRLTDYEKKLVQDEIPYVESLFNSIKFRFTPINPTGIFNELKHFGEENGKILKESFNYRDAEDNEVSGERVIGYIPKDPDAYTLVVMDHMALMKKERGFQTKEVIDKYSEYCTHLKNLFGFSFINIQQFNSSMSSVERLKFKGVDLSPQQSDFKDSTNPYADADVVFGIMCPYKLDLVRNLGYDVLRLKDKMIHLKVIKNRLSKDNVAVGLYVDAKSGSFKELEDPKIIKYEDYE